MNLFSKKKIIFVFGSIISAFAGILITVFVARNYSKEVNADYQYFLQFFQIVALIGWARSDQFLTSVKSPPNLKIVLNYLINKQLISWLIVSVSAVLFTYFTSFKFVTNFYFTAVILISGFFFGLVNLSNQMLIIRNKYELQGIYDFFQKAIFFVLLLSFYYLDIYLGFLMLIAMVIRFILSYFIYDIKHNYNSSYSNLEVMLINGKRMFASNVFLNISSLIIVYLVSTNYSKAFYADYALISTLISFPASIIGQYAGLILHRKFIERNLTFNYLIKFIFLSTISLTIFYLFILIFKSLIIGILGEKWATIWGIYYYLWPLSIFTFLASLLDKISFEIANSNWPIFNSFLRFTLLFCLMVIPIFGKIVSISFNIFYFQFIIAILYFSYIIDLTRNLYVFSKDSHN